MKDGESPQNTRRRLVIQDEDLYVNDRRKFTQHAPGLTVRPDVPARSSGSYTGMVSLQVKVDTSIFGN